MKKISLTIDLSTKELQEMVDRYHINDTDLFLVESLYQAMRPLLRATFYYEIRKENDKNVIIVVTLGKHLDQLQDLYSEVGAILESYLVECLGMRILEKGYKLAGEVIKQNLGYAITDYYFPDPEKKKDSQMPGVKDIIDSFGRSGMTSVIYNEAGILMPKKSVVFCARLCAGEEQQKGTICDQCENLNCENRKTHGETQGKENKEKQQVESPAHYGYQRIFGKKPKQEEESQ